MAKPKTHFEQVPLEIIKEIVGEQTPPEKPAGGNGRPRKKKAEKDLAARDQSKPGSRRSFQKELSE